MFYDRFVCFCKQKGVSPTRAALDAGISKSLVTKWKTNNVQDPSPDVLRRLAKYFNATVAELLGEDENKAPTENGERSVSDDEIKFALFGGDGEITDEMFERVKKFAAFIKQEEAEKKKE